MSFNGNYINSTAATLAQQNAAAGKGKVGELRLDNQKETLNLWQTNLVGMDLERVVIHANRDERGRHWLHDFLTALGGSRSAPVSSMEFAWFEKEAPNYGMFIDTVVTSSFPATTVQILTPQTTITRQVKELYHSPIGGFQYRVTAVTIDAGTGKELVTLTRANTAAANQILQTHIVAGSIMGYAGNAHQEDSGRMDGRIDYPFQKRNKVQILRAGFKETGLARATKKMVSFSANLGGQQFEFTQFDWENEVLRQFQTAREQALFLGSGSPTVADEHFVTRGILPDVVANSQLARRYAGNVEIEDYDAFFVTGDTLHQTNEYTVLCGGKFFRDSQTAAREYLDEGAQTFDAFDASAFTDYGIKVKSYSYGDKRMIFQRYRTMDDKQLMGALPAGASPTSTNYDYANFAIFLNMGDNAGTDQEGSPTGIPYLSYVYHAIDGVADRSMVTAFFGGMTGRQRPNNGGMGFTVNGTTDASAVMNVAYGANTVTPADADDFQILGTIGVRMPLVQIAHGWMAANA